MNKVDEVEFYLIDLKSKFDKIKPNTYYLSYSGGKDKQNNKEDNKDDKKNKENEGKE